MKSPNGYARGVVYRHGHVRQDGDGRNFLELTIEMEEPAIHRGKEWRQKVAVRSYRPKDMALARDLVRGTLVSVDAEAVDAVTWTDRTTGQVFSAARLTGAVTILSHKEEAP